ncbi:MAG: permease prefix domain 1-containing protein, partial [Oscillospiraceae bacterium]|nr:permease prefix domain 1-containing protein [Oscillospiraceae bacterium]
MKKSDYINTALEQVRCKTVHKALAKELEAHIDDCTEAFAAEGLSPDEAEEKSVLTMGDPVETGIHLDRVH